MLVPGRDPLSVAANMASFALGVISHPATWAAILLISVALGVTVDLHMP